VGLKSSSSRSTDDDQREARESLLSSESQDDAYNTGPSISSLRSSSSTGDNMRHGANGDDQLQDRQMLNSTDDVTQQTRPRSSVMKDDSARQKSSVMQDDNERGNAHGDARQPSRPADNDQRRQRQRKTSSSSSTEDSRDDDKHGAHQRDQQSPRPH